MKLREYLIFIDKKNNKDISMAIKKTWPRLKKKINCNQAENAAA